MGRFDFLCFCAVKVQIRCTHPDNSVRGGGGGGGVLKTFSVQCVIVASPGHTHLPLANKYCLSPVL